MDDLSGSPSAAPRWGKSTGCVGELWDASGCLKEKRTYVRLIPGTDVKLNTLEPIPACALSGREMRRAGLTYS